MDSQDLKKVKYFPDRFYICLDGFDMQNLTAFLNEEHIGQEQAVFIHEYYHYLTNIATPPGVRQFQVNFCDRFKLTTLLTYEAGLDAYPIKTNNQENCRDHIQYWNDILEILEEDYIDMDVVKEASQTQTGKFAIAQVEKVLLPKTFVIEHKPISGARKMIRIHTEGLVTKHDFYLTFGAIDEFLSSAIDEFLFENDLSTISHRVLSDRPFYPYGFFETLMAHYGIERPTALEKIMIASVALDAKQPPFALIEILEGLQNGGYESFQDDPESYLRSIHHPSPDYDGMLSYIHSFVKRTLDQDRVLISGALQLYHDIFLKARQLKQQDFLYFIRPFLVRGDNTVQLKQRFLQSLAQIVQQFNPPMVLKDKEFLCFDLTSPLPYATMLLLATYEIYESLKSSRIACRPARQKDKYLFPDEDENSDNIDALTPPPIYPEDIFRSALNQVGLYGIYLEEQQRRMQSGGAQ